MALLTILALICFAVIVGGLVWWVMQTRTLRCTNNGCLDDHTCQNWPFPHRRP